MHSDDCNLPVTPTQGHVYVPQGPSENPYRQLPHSSPSSVRDIRLPSPRPVPRPLQQTERKRVKETRSLTLRATCTSIHSFNKLSECPSTYSNRKYIFVRLFTLNGFYGCSHVRIMGVKRLTQLCDILFQFCSATCIYLQQEIACIIMYIRINELH